VTARRLKAHLAAVLLAFAVACVAGGALAHELDHQLHQQDVPCALHLYAGHLDGIAVSGVALPGVFAAPFDVVIPATASPTCRPIVRYTVRAPPRSI
jgi:hypothetical protein